MIRTIDVVVAIDQKEFHGVPVSGGGKNSRSQEAENSRIPETHRPGRFKNLTPFEFD
jgi:hypothetical protein